MTIGITLLRIEIGIFVFLRCHRKLLTHGSVGIVFIISSSYEAFVHSD